MSVSDLESAYAAAISFDDYRRELRYHKPIFNDVYERLAFVRGALPDPLFGGMRLLVLTEDWCPDSVINLPLIARLVENSPGASLRIVRRRDYRDIANRFPGSDGQNRIPTVIFMQADGQAAAYWSERDNGAHRWMAAFRKNDPFPNPAFSNDEPLPETLAWMERRFAAQLPIFFDGSWRDVCNELRETLSISA